MVRLLVGGFGVASCVAVCGVPGARWVDAHEAAGTHVTASHGDRWGDLSEVGDGELVGVVPVAQHDAQPMNSQPVP